MDYERLYAYRFRDVDQVARAEVWSEIAPWIHRFLGEPERVLDPAAGRGEFISKVPAPERWGVDLVAQRHADYGAETKVVIGDVMSADLPATHFDGIFVSNFLEHLASQEAVSDFLVRMYEVTRPGGRIAVMGPNYRYCASRYWDFADHVVALTHEAVAEHLYASGFEPERTVSRFLPYSFTGILPPSRILTRVYLRTPPLWRLLGKQFLMLGKRPG